MSVNAELYDSIRFLRGVLWTVLAISLAGVAFSGLLTYRELTGIATSCPAAGAPGTILGYPPCVYGLGMYAVLATVSGWGILHTRPSRTMTVAEV